MIPYSDQNGNVVEPKLTKYLNKGVSWGIKKSWAGTKAVGRGVRDSSYAVGRNIGGSLYNAAFSGDPLIENLAGIGGSGNNMSANGRVSYQNIRLPNGQIRRQKIVLPGGGFGGGMARVDVKSITKALSSITRQLSQSNVLLSNTRQSIRDLADKTKAIVRLTVRSINTMESVNRNLIVMKNFEVNRRLTDDAYRTKFEHFLTDKFNELKAAIGSGNSPGASPKKSGWLDGLMSKFGWMKNLASLFGKTGIGSLINTLGKKLGSTVLGAMAVKGASKLGGFAKRVSPLMGKVGDVLSNGYSKLAGGLSSTAMKAKDAALMMGGKIVGGMRTVATGAGGAIARAAATFSAMIKSGGWKRLLSTAGRGALGVLRFLPGVGIVASAVWVAIELYDVMKNLTADIDFGQMFTNIGDKLIDAFNSVKNKIANVFGLGDNQSTSPSPVTAPFGVMKSDQNGTPTSAMEYVAGLNKQYGVNAAKPSLIKSGEITPNFTTAEFVKAGESSGRYDQINMNDTGGTKSYGAYQFNTGGVLPEFMKTTKFRGEFADAPVGSNRFNDIWIRLAKESDEFKKEQDEFFIKKFRDEARTIYKESTGQEAGKLTEAVITSMKVRGTNVLNNALAGMKDQNLTNDKDIAKALLEESRKNVNKDYVTALKTGGVGMYEQLQKRISDDYERIGAGKIADSVKGTASKVGGVVSDMVTGKFDWSATFDDALNFVGENIDAASKNISDIYAGPDASPVQTLLNEKIKMNQEELANRPQGSGGIGNISMGGTNVSTSPITNNSNTTIIYNEVQSIDKILGNQLY